ncbi:MAG: DUF502 domain-containing protein [Crinalium sp.]
MQVLRKPLWNDVSSLKRCQLILIGLSGINSFFTASCKESRRSVLQRFKQDLKNDLIAGLLVVIPLATTIWLTITIANWVINFLTRIPKQINPFDGLNPILVNLLNLLVGLTVPLMCIMLIGLMARNIVGRWLLDIGEQLLQAIPLAGSVYKTLKQLLETLLKDSNDKFRRVIMVEYPRRGMWVLAFVTGTINSEIQSQMSERMLSVFIPTTPNPTTGWYAIVPDSDVIDLSMSIEDAFKVVVSGGIVNPGSSTPILPPSYNQKPLEQPISDIPEISRQVFPAEEG